jgi:hypothetical protein
MAAAAAWIRNALIFATRQIGGLLMGLPELRAGALGHRNSRALLESVLPVRLDEDVLRRIIADTHGNPLALLELPRGLTPAQLAAESVFLCHSHCLTGSKPASHVGWAKLPRDARRLLLVAAAEPVGDPALVWRAAQILGLSHDAPGQVEAEGLLSFGAEVSFRHPPVRRLSIGRSDPTSKRRHRVAGCHTPEPSSDHRRLSSPTSTLLTRTVVATPAAIGYAGVSGEVRERPNRTHC